MVDFPLLSVFLPPPFFLFFFFFFYLELLFMNRLHASSFSYSIFYHISFILTCYRGPHPPPPPFAVVLSQLWAIWTIFLDLFSTLFFFDHDISYYYYVYTHSLSLLVIHLLGRGVGYGLLEDDDDFSLFFYLSRT